MKLIEASVDGFSGDARSARQKPVISSHRDPSWQFVFQTFEYQSQVHSIDSSNLQSSWAFSVTALVYTPDPSCLRKAPIPPPFVPPAHQISRQQSHTGPFLARSSSCEPCRRDAAPCCSSRLRAVQSHHEDLGLWLQSRCPLLKEAWRMGRYLEPCSTQERDQWASVVAARQLVEK